MSAAEGLSSAELVDELTARPGFTSAVALELAGRLELTARDLVPHPAWCDREHGAWAAHVRRVADEPLDTVSLRVEVYLYGDPMVTLTRVEQAMDERWLPIVGQFSEEFLAGMPAPTARRIARRILEAADLVEGLPAGRLSVNEAEAELRAFGEMSREQAEVLWSMHHRRGELNATDTEQLLTRFEPPAAVRARFEDPADGGAR